MEDSKANDPLLAHYFPATPSSTLTAPAPPAALTPTATVALRHGYGHAIYEAFHPRTLAEAKEYIAFVLGSRSIIPNGAEDPDPSSPVDSATVAERGAPDYDFGKAGEGTEETTAVKRYLRETARRNKELRAYPMRYLVFDSSFECGNLDRVVARSECEYDLYLSSDTNAANRCQWFYFLTTNTKQGLAVKFNILNMTKYPHFVKDGMRPLVFSEKDHDAIYTAWTSKVDSITVSRSPFFPSKSFGTRTISLDPDVDSSESERHGSSKTVCYCMSFVHTFKHDDDRVFFSLFKPYAYTRMQSFLKHAENALEKEAVLFRQKGKPQHPSGAPSADSERKVQIVTRGLVYTRKRLCCTLSGIPVDLIKITSNDFSCSTAVAKTYIIITARAHAAETAGSHKVQGVIEFLLGKSPVAESLRRHHTFLVVPMLNPDGVVMGNNRCSLAGYDMNRCWGAPPRKTEPVVYALKTLLNKIRTVRKEQILVYCDLHGHSKLFNSFIYACHKGTIGTLCSWTQVRLLPRILAKRCHMLDYNQCSFRVEPSKEFKVVNSFTLESSQYAYTIGEEVIRFTERDYARISDYLMQALDEYRKLIEELHTEIGQSSEWLRPCRLAELTGVPAAELLRREIAEEKEEARKRERRERLRAKLHVRPAHDEDRSRVPVPSPPRKSPARAERRPQAAERVETVLPTVPPKPVGVSWKDYFTEGELNAIREQCQSEGEGNDFAEVREECEIEEGDVVEEEERVHEEKSDSSDSLPNAPKESQHLTVSPEKNAKANSVTQTSAGVALPVENSKKSAKRQLLAHVSPVTVLSIAAPEESPLRRGRNDWESLLVSRPQLRESRLMGGRVAQPGRASAAINKSVVLDAGEAAAECFQRANVASPSKALGTRAKDNSACRRCYPTTGGLRRRERLVPLSVLYSSISAEEQAAAETVKQKLNFQSFFHYHKCDYTSQIGKPVPRAHEERRGTLRHRRTTLNPCPQERSSFMGAATHGLAPTRKKRPMREILGTQDEEEEGTRGIFDDCQRRLLLANIFAGGKHNLYSGNE